MDKRSPDVGRIDEVRKFLQCHCPVKSPLDLTDALFRRAAHGQPLIPVFVGKLIGRELNSQG